LRYCSDCGAALARRVPPDDNRPRAVCDHCGAIHYENPKVVTGCLVVRGSRVLLCRRAIEPRRGYWTLPAGYLELEETSSEGARRETLEEAGAEVRVGPLFLIYDVPHLSQVQLFFRAELTREGIAPGPESLEVAFVEIADIPWSELAFSAVRAALELLRDRGLEDPQPAHRDAYRGDPRQ
jgi:ADP-ribose pyrophosphatase YjhB (NUDIX family)